MGDPQQAITPGGPIPRQPLIGQNFRPDMAQLSRSQLKTDGKLLIELFKIVKQLYFFWYILLRWFFYTFFSFFLLDTSYIVPPGVLGPQSGISSSTNKQGQTSELRAALATPPKLDQISLQHMQGQPRAPMRLPSEPALGQHQLPFNAQRSAGDTRGPHDPSKGEVRPQYSNLYYMPRMASGIDPRLMINSQNPALIGAPPHPGAHPHIVLPQGAPFHQNAEFADRAVARPTSRTSQPSPRAPTTPAGPISPALSQPPVHHVRPQTPQETSSTSLVNVSIYYLLFCRNISA